MHSLYIYQGFDIYCIIDKLMVFIKYLKFVLWGYADALYEYDFSQTDQIEALFGFLTI